jgi:hypothetical protein
MGQSDDLPDLHLLGRVLVPVHYWIRDNWGDSYERSTGYQRHDGHASKARARRLLLERCAGKLVTLATSLLALLAAIAGLTASRCTTRGIVAKNEAILAQNIITDQWAYYQSKNIRQDIHELALGMQPQGISAQQKIQKAAQIEKLRQQREEISALARSKEKERDLQNKLAEYYLEVSRTFACALVLLQVALVLTPMTLLVKKRSLLTLGSAIGALGMVYFLWGFVEFFKRPFS